MTAEFAKLIDEVSLIVVSAIQGHLRPLGAPGPGQARNTVSKSDNPAEMLRRQTDLFEKKPAQLASAESGLKGQVIHPNLPGLLDDRGAKALHYGAVAGVTKTRLEKLNALRRRLRFRYLLNQSARIGAPNVAQRERLVGSFQPRHWQKGLGHAGPEPHAETGLSGHE